MPVSIVQRSRRGAPDRAPASVPQRCRQSRWPSGLGVAQFGARDVPGPSSLERTETQKAKLTTRDATWCQLQLSRQSSPCTVHAKCESARTGAPSEFVTATDCEKTRNSLTVASYLVFCILGRRLPALFQVAFCRCPYGARRRNMGKSMQFVSKRGRNAQRHQGTRESVEDG